MCFHFHAVLFQFTFVLTDLYLICFCFAVPHENLKFEFRMNILCFIIFLILDLEVSLLNDDCYNFVNAPYEILNDYFASWDYLWDFACINLHV